MKDFILLLCCGSMLAMLFYVILGLVPAWAIFIPMIIGTLINMQDNKK